MPPPLRMSPALLALVLALPACAWLSPGAASGIEAGTALACAGLTATPIGPVVVAICAGLLPAEKLALDAAVTHAAATVPAPVGQSAIEPNTAPVMGTREGRRVVLAYVPARLQGETQRHLDGAAR